jgi:cyanophycinase-like exopeptidase
MPERIKMDLLKGKIVLMGSGELTATMVELHKELLSAFGSFPRAVFLDTPAGFQLNCDQISRKAVEFFKHRVGADLTVASFKSADSPGYDMEIAFQALRTADYILIGPGSPTYTIDHLLRSPVPDIFEHRVLSGGCLVSASAAALTMGKLTLPVYEIYKVGKPLYWERGIDILGRFGFDLVVIPHWNNAEGGSHDTRFCFMGGPRLKRLEELLPENLTMLGIDEHTAIIFDFAAGQAQIRGLGKVVVRRNGKEAIIEKESRIPLKVFQKNGDDSITIAEVSSGEPLETLPPGPDHETEYWTQVRNLENHFKHALEKKDSHACTTSLLELDRVIWKAKEDLESDEFISQGREVFRDLLVVFGAKFGELSSASTPKMVPVVEELLRLRERFRDGQMFKEADDLRDILLKVGISVEDTSDGPRWHFRA